jgi:hypothetical protein
LASLGREGGREDRDLVSGAPVEFRAWQQPGQRPGTSHTTYTFSPTKPVNYPIQLKPGSGHTDAGLGLSASTAVPTPIAISGSGAFAVGFNSKRCASISAEAQAAARAVVEAVKREAAAESRGSTVCGEDEGRGVDGDGVVFVGRGTTRSRPPLKFFTSEYDAEQFGSPQHVATTFLQRPGHGR